MAVVIYQSDARKMSEVEDESVDLIVTSPPYYGQRSYQDAGEHYEGQIGCEEHPQQYLEALWEVTAECWRVLKPEGSMWVNLGDKRAGSGAPGTTSGLSGRRVTGTPVGLPGTRVQGERSGGIKQYTQEYFGRRKSKQMLPHRYAIGCEDGSADPEGIGWVVRQDQVWWKRGGLPESVQDRTRDSHEYWFHLTKSEHYYSAIDEIRDPHADVDPVAAGLGYERFTEGDPSGQDRTENTRGTVRANHPLGRLPASVWDINPEPLIIPAELNVEHFAAFPVEWPRRLILGWSPSAVCTVCGEGRRPVVEKDTYFDKARDQEHATDIARRAVERSTVSGGTEHSTLNGQTTRTIIGYRCACTPKTNNRGQRGDWRNGRSESAVHGNAFDTGSGNAVPRRPGGFTEGGRTPPPDKPMIEYDLANWTPPPTRPAVVLDPFMGTGTTVACAHLLGRTGIGVELSADYIRVANWRLTDPNLRSKVLTRTNTEAQHSLF